VLPQTTQPLPSPTSYDEVPYESHPYPQTHPGRLAAVATLFGLRPPAVESARVLELGCALGGNLTPMAEAFPGATFLGVDASVRQIGDAQRFAERLGLPNLTLRHADILDLGPDLGTFDYILCHGVFSWVPTPVQEKMLALCANHLAPSGIAYISYNTYPGWHMRGMIRDMMCYHARKFAAPGDRVRQARALLDFLAESARPDGALYPALLKHELEALRHQADSYLYHDHMEEVNDPLYFHEFVERAGAHGLRYLGEARVGTMTTSNFPPDVDKALKLLATDQIATEQYMDFLRNRAFRETLLVHGRNVPNWQVRPERVERLHVASGAVPVEGDAVDVQSDAAVRFRSPSGLVLATTRPLLKAAMVVLGQAWPGTLPFAELLTQARAAAGLNDPATAEADARNLGGGLVDSYLGSDMIELHGAPIVATNTASEKPLAIPSARLRAEEGRPVTNRRHELVRLGDLERCLLTLLDGTRDRPALVEECIAAVNAGRLRLDRDGREVTDPADVKATLTAIIDQPLSALAKQALLIG
jgi:methyltransferase-like protein/2-polyprenyl-3-methyl-5-hydroxy-6-metoxy-1,4-benzoquinol methylase